MNFYSHHIFPRLMDLMMSDKDFQDLRKSVLKNVTGDVFEIGFGTGLNLPHYPPSVTRITTVDPNPGSRKLAERKIAQSPIEVVHQTISGEQLPMNDNTFDSVVCTFTLCSIANVDAAVHEMRRILRKGGRMYFIEHGLSKDPGVQRWQNRINPLNRVIFDGCHLNRNPVETISRNGLQIESLDNFYYKKAPKFAGYFYRGIAVK